MRRERVSMSCRSAILFGAMLVGALGTAVGVRAQALKDLQTPDTPLVLKAQGATPRDSSPLWFVAGDHAYEVSVEIDMDPGATAGLLVFYNNKLYAGLGSSPTNFVMHRYGTERQMPKPAHLGRKIFLRLTNDRHIVTIHYSADGRTWERFGTRMEVSGYHHNVMYDFLSLRPAIYAAGPGEVRFRRFTYKALP